MINTTSWQPPEQTVYPPQYVGSSTDSPGGTITCGICNAGFTPSPARQDLSQASPVALEAAFMSMCHFCFRCRRPACPECWDAVHGVCGACVQEAHLPFRAEAAHLGRVSFPPLHHQYADQSRDNKSSPLLVCIHSGHFRTEISLSTVATLPLKTFPVVPMKELPGVVDHEDQQEFASPSQQPSPQLVVDHEDQQEFTSPSQQPSPQLPEQEENQGRPVKAPGLSFLKTAERVLNVLILVILLAIVALIVLAEISSTANIQIERLLHIDIRSEVAYLIAAIRQLHW